MTLTVVICSNETMIFKITFLMLILCRDSMDEQGSETAAANTRTRQQTGPDVHVDPEDLMDTSVGEEEGAEPPDDDELLKTADSLLDSPSSHKEKVANNINPRPVSVSSLVSDLNINADPQLKKIPGDPTDKNGDINARIQSDLDCGKKPIMVSTGTETDPHTGTVSNSINKNSVSTGTGTDDGTGIGSSVSNDTGTKNLDAGGGAGVGAGTDTGKTNFAAFGAGVGVGTGAGAGTGTGTGNKSDESISYGKKRFRECSVDPPRRADSAFPPDYWNVRRAREKLNPCVELPTPGRDRRKEAVCLRPRPGFDLKSDDRQYKVNNYHVPTLKKMLVPV
jgi:hypothetical protein